MQHVQANKYAWFNGRYAPSTERGSEAQAVGGRGNARHWSTIVNLKWGKKTKGETNGKKTWGELDEYVGEVQNEEIVHRELKIVHRKFMLI